uniref:Cyclic di-GMP-binding protein n=2 Tax=Cereibacter TaxID=1653176 RepID=A4WR50_CERS5
MRAPLLACLLLAVPLQASRAQEAPMIVIEGLTPEEQAQPAPAATPEPVAPWLLPLRPVLETVQPGRVLRIQGQQAQAEFRLFLPQEALGGTLTLAQRSSIDVLPEASRIVVRLNGAEIGSFEPRQFGALGAVEMPLGTAARAGDNLVTIEAQHRHRIYCGADAEFNLWTDIDLSQSGLAMAGPALGTGPNAFIAALTAQAASGRPIEIRAAETPDADILRELAQVLGRPLPDEALPIALARPWTTSAGRSFARVTLLGSDTDRATIRRGGDGALVLVIEHQAGAAPRLALVEELLQDDAALPPPVLPQVPPGQTTTLAALGVPTIVTEERYFYRKLDFRLPDDWLLLASQKARIGIDYGFAEGLAEGALLLVKVNGTTVRMLPLDREAAPQKPRLEIPFPARLLRPGANRLAFEAIIPGNPPDEPCPAGQGELLAVLDTTDLTVPPSPRMRMADMAQDLAQVSPEAVQPATPEGLARALPFMSAFRDAAGGGQVRMTVAGIHDLGRMPLAEEGLTPRLLAMALLPSSAMRLDLPEVPVADAGADPLSPLGAAPGERTMPALVESNWLDRARAFTLATLEPALDGMRRLARPGDGELTEWFAARKGIAMLLSPEPGHLWVVLGPGAEPAKVATALAVAVHSPVGPRGQVSLLAEDGSWSSWSAPGLMPQLEEPVSLSNVRSVVGNVASARPPLLLGGMLGLAWISAAIAVAFVLRTRARSRS